MINLVICDDQGNKKRYTMKTYKISKEADCVIVNFELDCKEVSYSLKTDVRFNTLENIVDYLGKTISRAVSEGYEIKITEYLERMYIYIGYETDEEYENGQFTASRL